MIDSEMFIDINHYEAYKICKTLIASMDWGNKNGCTYDIFISGDISITTCKKCIKLCEDKNKESLAIICALMANLGMGFRLLLLRQAKFTGIPHIARDGNKTYINHAKEESLIANVRNAYRF